MTLGVKDYSENLKAAAELLPINCTVHIYTLLRTISEVQNSPGLQVENLKLNLRLQWLYQLAFMPSLASSLSLLSISNGWMFEAYGLSHDHSTWAELYELASWSLSRRLRDCQCLTSLITHFPSLRAERNKGRKPKLALPSSPCSLSEMIPLTTQIREGFRL